MNGKHTPGPWQRSGARRKLGQEDCIQVGPDGFPVAVLPIGRTPKEHAGAIADADRIVQCVNAHDGLVEALRDLLMQVENFAAKYGEADFETARAHRALTANTSPAGGEFAWLPVEATDEMVHAAESNATRVAVAARRRGDSDDEPGFRSTYRAMVRAAIAKATGSVEPERCTACQGTGGLSLRKPSQMCSVCKGTGKTTGSAVDVRRTRADGSDMPSPPQQPAALPAPEAQLERFWKDHPDEIERAFYVHAEREGLDSTSDESGTRSFADHTTEVAWRSWNTAIHFVADTTSQRDDAKDSLVEALKPFGKLLEQAAARGLTENAHVDCQIAIADLRRAHAAIAKTTGSAS